MILRANPSAEARTCAVKSLWRQVRRREREGATGGDVLFANPRIRKPYSRNVFTTRLKQRIDAVASSQIGDVKLRHRPSTYIAGISFRKAVLQKLKDANMKPTRIATYASHKSIQAQMAYVAETFEVKGSGDMAKALYKGLR